MVKKKVSVTSRKPLVGEALYQKLMENEFASITMNESRLIKEDWLQVNAQEEALLRAMLVTIPAMNEPDQVKESTLLTERTKLADLYYRSGLEADNVAGIKRVDTFLEKTKAAIERINGKNIDKSLH